MAESGGNHMNAKRKDVLSWEDYFMGIAFLSGQRSKDPATQVGACIINEEKRIVGVGYNGMPQGCHDDDFPWGKDKERDILNQKYPYVCHAEMNAIINKNSASLKDCTIYVSLFPCNECAKLIIQSGIQNVVYCSDKNWDKPEAKASREMLRYAHVTYRKYVPTKPKIEIDFESIRHKEPKTKPTSNALQYGDVNLGLCTPTMVNYRFPATATSPLSLPNKTKNWCKYFEPFWN